MSRGTARGGRDSKAFQQISPSKQAFPRVQHSSFPAFKLPIPLLLHSLHPHPFPPIFSPYPHPTRTFPHKAFVLRSACRSNVSDDTDASSTPTWCNKPDDVLCQQLSTRSTHAKGKRGKGRGKREEEELKNMYVKVYSSSIWLDMPTVSFLRGPQKSLQNSGLCEGFCKIDKVVLQIKEVGGQRWGSPALNGSHRETVGNDRKCPLMLDLGGKKPQVTFPRVECTLEKMGDSDLQLHCQDSSNA